MYIFCTISYVRSYVQSIYIGWSKAVSEVTSAANCPDQICTGGSHPNWFKDVCLLTTKIRKGGTIGMPEHFAVYAEIYHESPNYFDENKPLLWKCAQPPWKIWSSHFVSTNVSPTADSPCISQAGLEVVMTQQRHCGMWIDSCANLTLSSVQLNIG